MQKLLSPKPLWNSAGLATLRIMTGMLMVYHGIEIFQPETMEVYQGWDVIKKLPAPVVMVYLGKGLEFITGICLVLGIFTRMAALLMAIDLLFICFVVGNGKFYYEDQHPFLFAMLALVFFFTGPVRWSLDEQIFK